MPKRRPTWYLPVADTLPRRWPPPEDLLRLRGATGRLVRRYRRLRQRVVNRIYEMCTTPNGNGWL